MQLSVIKKHPVKTSLFASKAPLEWAIVNNGTLYTAQIPIDDTGTVVEGGIEAQTRQTFNNLIHTLECAGESLDSVLQVLIYVTDREYLKTVNQVYAEYFEAPSRSTFASWPNGPSGSPSPTHFSGLRTSAL